MYQTLLRCLFTLMWCGICACCLAQEGDEPAFSSAQLTAPRVMDAFRKFDDSAAREFKRRYMVYPPSDIFLRVFKLQNEMELWARNGDNYEYRLVKIFRICAISGSLGPKRNRGDRQVPEGFYFIEEFNPKSDYYLSMQLNYPNYADRQSGSSNLGGDIFIHGGCVTIGCLPMTDDGIRELYVICLRARLNGEAYIPVHVFPTRLTNSGMAYLKKEFPKDSKKLEFWGQLKTSYDFFEKYHRLLPVMYRPDGGYAY